MFEKYIVINEAKIICGQTNSGTWYCKELPCKDTKEMDQLICEVNSILNKYNKTGIDETVRIKTGVKGLK